jgi:winged helix DNA-binding protein
VAARPVHRYLDAHDQLPSRGTNRGLTGARARRAWRGARIRAHVLHHHETALWHARPGGRFVALEDPEEHDPTEARAEILLLAFADRTRVLPEEYRKTVIRMNGDVAQTFLDGFVAGIWSVENGRVVLESFAPLSRASQRELREEAGRPEAFLAD